MVEDGQALTAVLVILEDFAHVAGVHEAEELLDKAQTERTELLLLQAESLRLMRACLVFKRCVLAGN